MKGAIWVSGVMSDYAIGNKQGVREKFYGEDWAPPTFQLSDSPTRVQDAYRRYLGGETLERTDFPEAMYVFAESNWRGTGDLFCAGPFYAVRGALAEVLKEFDLGTGGLIEFPIYEADKTTRLPGPFYLLNFGGAKDSFVAAESRNLLARKTIEKHGYERWAGWDLEDGDVALTAAAFGGADLWHERRLQNLLFMSGRLHDAIRAAKVRTNFRFARTRILG